MSVLLEGTPISLITSSEVKWEVCYDIYPIQIEHALQIAELISEDDFFTGIDVSMVCQSNEVTNVVLKADRLWLDLSVFSDVGERRLNSIIDNYLDLNGGYEAAQA